MDEDITIEQKLELAQIEFVHASLDYQKLQKASEEAARTADQAYDRVTQARNTLRSTQDEMLMLVRLRIEGAGVSG